jgi:triosephosphate isomerase
LRRESEKFAIKVVELVKDYTSKVDVVLAPAYTLLDIVFDVIHRTGIQLGAQDVFWKDSGAFTGEVSPYMLKDVGCDWVIIGHSERRNILKETDDMIREKIHSSLKAGLKVILCVGETEEERAKGKTVKTIEGQLVSDLQNLALGDISRLAIAYEPVWAIGTGKNATPEEIGYVHSVIRDLSRDILKVSADKLRILYGGSVTHQNIREIITTDNVDGALVGGASLDAYAFSNIVKVSGD